MGSVLLVDPVLGEGAWVYLREALSQLGISSTPFEPQPVHTYDQEVEAAALYQQVQHVDTGDTDLALAVGSACGPAVHGLRDKGWLAGKKLILLDPTVGPLIKQLPDLRKFLLSHPGSSKASVAAAALAGGRLVRAAAKRLPQFVSGRSIEATEGLFHDLSSNDKERRWAELMAEATRKKEPIDAGLHDNSGLGVQVLNWYEPWLKSGGADVEVWYRRSTGLARFAEQQPERQGRFRLIDAPRAAWVNAPELLALQISNVLPQR